MCVVIVFIGNYGCVVVYVVCVFGIDVVVCMLLFVLVNKVDVVVVFGVCVVIVGDS